MPDRDPEDVLLRQQGRELVLGDEFGRKKTWRDEKNSDVRLGDGLGNLVAVNRARFDLGIVPGIKLRVASQRSEVLPQPLQPFAILNGNN